MKGKEKMKSLRTLKIFTSIYTTMLLLGLITSASVAAKPIPTETPTPTPAPLPSTSSEEWIGLPTPQEIVAIIPLVDSTSLSVVWDPTSQTVRLMNSDHGSNWWADWSWLVGSHPSTISVAACGRDLWIGASTPYAQVQYYELPADASICSPTTITYTPLYIPMVEK